MIIPTEPIGGVPRPIDIATLRATLVEMTSGA